MVVTQWAFRGSQTRWHHSFVLPNSDLKDSSKGFIINQKWDRSIMQLCKNSWGKASLRRWSMSHQSVPVKLYIIYPIMPSSVRTRQQRSGESFICLGKGKWTLPKWLFILRDKVQPKRNDIILRFRSYKVSNSGWYWKSLPDGISLWARLGCHMILVGW